jgi:hypothetical protein
MVNSHQQRLSVRDASISPAIAAWSYYLFKYATAKLVAATSKPIASTPPAVVLIARA